jgi:hypothetical protein
MRWPLLCSVLTGTLRIHRTVGQPRDTPPECEVGGPAVHQLLRQCLEIRHAPDRHGFGQPPRDVVGPPRARQLEFPGLGR